MGINDALHEINMNLNRVNLNAITHIQLVKIIRSTLIKVNPTPLGMAYIIAKLIKK